jgi:midasin (ATPase involved in ribosome maturation)
MSNEIVLRIAELQKKISDNEQVINRCYFENVNNRLDLKELQTKRDELSGLKTRVIDSEIQMGVSYHGGRL